MIFVVYNFFTSMLAFGGEFQVSKGCEHLLCDLNPEASLPPPATFYY